MAERGRGGAVAAGHALTARAARFVLEEGGNAVDAAVAAAWMACVAEPVLASPGGGGFAMVSDGPRAAPELCDFFVQTPGTARPGADFRAVEADFGTTTQTFHIGPGSMAAPGFVPGLFALHARHGRMDMARLLAPAIEVAEEGMTLTAFEAFLMGVVAPILLDTPAARALYAPDGALLTEGARLVNADMGRLFRRLAAGGLDAWREEVTPALLELAAAGGHLTEADVAGYEVCWRRPIVVEVGDGRAWLNPPPAGSGVMIALAQRALAGGDADAAAAVADCPPCGWALALAAADAARRRAGHDIAALAEAAGLGTTAGAECGPPAARGTTHISVIDGAGQACAMTISNGEGNGQIVPGFGFMPNNMLGETDVNPHGAAGWPRGVRLSSMMAPSLAADGGGAWFALGSGGSNRIRSVIFLMLQRLLVRGAPLAAAVAAPRLHVEEGHLDFEPGFDEAEAARLTALFADHRAWPEKSLFFGGCHAVARGADGTPVAAGDARRAGHGEVIAGA